MLCVHNLHGTERIWSPAWKLGLFPRRRRRSRYPRGTTCCGYGIPASVVDTGDERETLAKEMGAEAFVDFKKVENPAQRVLEITKGGAHGVFVTGKSYWLCQAGFKLIALPKSNPVIPNCPRLPGTSC